MSGSKYCRGADWIENGWASPEAVGAARDTDADGRPDFQDLDSDGDGIWDLLEAGAPRSLDTNNDGKIDVFIDIDKDGISDIVDALVKGGVNGLPIVLKDTDGDGIPDLIDPDSDGDGFPDAAENGDYDGDGVADNLQDLGALKPISGGGAVSVWILAILAGLGVMMRKSVVPGARRSRHWLQAL